MKKILLLAVAALLSLLQINAQQSSNLFFLKRGQSKNAKVTSRLLQLQSGYATAQKPTGIKQRVVAQATDSEFFLKDSTRFTYTGTNGSSYDFNNLEYNYTDYFTSGYAPMFILPYEGNSSPIVADSIIRYDQDGAYRQSKAFYRADKKIDSIWDYTLNGTLLTRSKVINVYNGQGHLRASYNIQENSTAVWDTVSYKHFSYNGTFTQMIRDSTWVGVNPILSKENIYFYSTNSQPDSVVTWDLQGPGPVRDYSFNMTYNGAGKLVTVRGYDFNSGAPVLYSLDSIGYTSGVDYFTYYEESIYDNDTLSEGTREIKFVGAGGLVDSSKLYIKEDTSATWVYLWILRYTYNSYHNPIKLTISYKSGIADNPDLYKFYYETYDDGVSSITPIAENKDLSIYPNPFQNNIIIDWKSKRQSAVTVQLTNILGREVYSTLLKLNAGENTIELPLLNSGNYILVIRDSEGKSWSGKVVKE